MLTPAAKTNDSMRVSVREVLFDSTLHDGVIDFPAFLSHKKVERRRMSFAARRNAAPPSQFLSITECEEAFVPRLLRSSHKILLNAYDRAWRFANNRVSIGTKAAVISVS